MIYNLVEYLKNEFPTELFYTNSRIKTATQTVIPDRSALVKETGGPETPWFQFVKKTVQVLTRDKTDPKARKLAWDIYKKLSSRFGLILPAVAVDGENFPEIHTAQISAIQQPYPLGADNEGRMQFTTNYEIIYRRA